MNSPTQREYGVVAAIAFLGLVVLPLLNGAVPESSALHLTTFQLGVFGKYLCYAVLALGVNLLWGQTGILSLGQCLFFALGGYALGMHLMLLIGKLGQYHADIPDFMVFLEFPKRYPSTGGLPPHWIPFRNLGFALAAVVIVPALVATAFGWLAFRSRIKGVYFSILSQALTYAATLLFFRNDFTFGGNNGLTDFKDILGFNIQAQGTRACLFIASVAALAGCYLLARFMVHSAYGKVLIAIRDAESRSRFLGYRVEHFKLLAFTVSASMAGLAGALYVPQIGIINPSEFAPGNSIEAVIWVAVGGRGTLVGAALGAVLVNFSKTWLTGAMPEVWLFALGALFIVVTLFLPKGIIGTASEMLKNRRDRQTSGQTEEVRP